MGAAVIGLRLFALSGVHSVLDGQRVLLSEVHTRVWCQESHAACLDMLTQLRAAVLGVKFGMICNRRCLEIPHFKACAEETLIKPTCARHHEGNEHQQRCTRDLNLRAHYSITWSSSVSMCFPFSLQVGCAVSTYRHNEHTVVERTGSAAFCMNLTWLRSRFSAA